MPQNEDGMATLRQLYYFGLCLHCLFRLICLNTQTIYGLSHGYLLGTSDFIWHLYRLLWESFLIQKWSNLDKFCEYLPKNTEKKRLIIKV